MTSKKQTVNPSLQIRKNFPNINTTCKIFMEYLSFPWVKALMLPQILKKCLRCHTRRAERDQMKDLGYIIVVN